MSVIYLDNNATTHLDPLVAERMHELNLLGVSNPASQHRPGRQALHLLEEAKTQIAQSVGVHLTGSDGAQVILTSGGTEANNLAIFGSVSRRPGIVIVGGTDHPSVVEAARHAVQPQDLRVLPVDEHGICDFNLLESWLRDLPTQLNQQVSLVSIMLGNNETGVLQDLKTVCDICRRFDVPVHSDVVQAIGKVSLGMHELGLSCLTLTGHKIHGPVGIGALVVDANFQLDPVIIGGGQQLGLRAGTEPVIPAVGLATSLMQILAALDTGAYEQLRRLRDQFERTILDGCEAYVIAARSPRLPHTSNIAFPGIDRQALQMSLDLKGVACSTGSACSSGSGRPSGSLVAMGLADELVQGSLRFSFSRFSTAAEIETASQIILESVHKCRVPA